MAEAALAGMVLCRLAGGVGWVDWRAGLAVTWPVLPGPHRRLAR
jgi:hypothetical protein